MAKKIIYIICLLAVPLMCIADNFGGTLISFKTGYYNPVGTVNQNPKSPVEPPIVYIDGYTLTFMSDCSGYEVEVIDEQAGTPIEVYDTIIPTGATSMQLPSYLSGTYVIRFIFDDYYFWGYIAL